MVLPFPRHLFSRCQKVLYTQCLNCGSYASTCLDWIGLLKVCALVCLFFDLANISLKRKWQV